MLEGRELAIIVFLILAVALIFSMRRSGRLKRELKAANDSVDDERADAVRRSRAVGIGKTVEHLVPFMPNFPYDPADARFLGSPIDLVVFDGLRERDQVREVVFVEIKTGRSQLSARERSLKEAIEAGRVRWHEERVDVT